jgi:peptidoglycan hydrolase CwlO-like protein
MTKIREILKTIAEYWKGITAVVSIITTIAVVAVKIDRKHFRDEIRTQEKTELKEDVTAIGRKVDTLFTYVEGINKSLTGITKEMEDERKSRETLQRSYIDYVRKNTKNTEELYNVLKDFIEEKKNSETSCLLIR